MSPSCKSVQALRARYGKYLKKIPKEKRAKFVARKKRLIAAKKNNS
ncbi:MAG: hypothetical protein AB1767_12340 [Bacillota bacterium]